ncbi:uncharacterized protein FIBRA_02668 [Fibroporia radiculosa]|uniref:DUF4110 domain-containing protein n=1 Tax=Fibroporia radiculosa TaxID=599839 RepID=J4I967_9APHY|nr:uncharacterized protein FIBRA_02668 [Fibroporia radiculosa]CCM00631.1 predicted protein [Fibroporia radiculosa]
MAKKKPGKDASRAATKAAKKAKAAQKVQRKDKKKVGKSKEEDEDDQDLEGILDRIQREWEEAHKVTEELVEGPPSRRANATLTPCPSGNYLWCIGGEFFSDDGKAYFYNDVFRYSPDKDEWRKFVSPTCPGPRSAHALVASPAGGGKLFLFGGEFSSLYQNSFHHYRDFWCFDISTHAWDRIDTKIKPTARSGHRMAMWKHYIVLFGGFYDPGIRTNYLNDLWLFDTQEYKWKQVELRDAERKPSLRFLISSRSRWNTLTCMHEGGYCKEYHKGSRPIGVMLDDTWFLRITVNETKDGKAPAEPLTLKWERRKRPSTAYAPSLRSGCTMTLWTTRNTGILFGGVTDEDTSEETMESVFHNDLYGYQVSGNGRWISMLLKRPKKKSTGAKKQKSVPAPARAPSSDEEDDEGNSEQSGDEITIQARTKKKSGTPLAPASASVDPENDLDDPDISRPMPRYNAMLAVLRNTLYIYGGIFERGSREYTLDDFHSLQLDKLDRYTCLKSSGITIAAEGDEESSDDDDDDDDDDSDSDDGEGGEDESEGEDPGAVASKSPAPAEDADQDAEVEVVEQGTLKTEKDALRLQAAAFMGVAKDATRSAEDIISTPLPGETLAMFYARSREYWTGRAHGNSGNRGKELRRDGFAKAEERYAAYKPILEEVERILAEAGLDEEEMRKGAAVGPAGSTGQSRNRR